MSIKIDEKTIATGLAIITTMISAAGNLYNMISRIKGEIPIPSFEDLIKQNAELQERIDAEK